MRRADRRRVEVSAATHQICHGAHERDNVAFGICNNENEYIIVCQSQP